MKTYSIHDTVHGYITFPQSYINCIIDTPEFQRLRRIEQTAIRAVFPTARHDRFVHSLGVYYVGKRILEHFINNDFGGQSSDANCAYKLISDDKELLESYKIACLLHDVGHAPFSHSFEKYFDTCATKNLMTVLIESFGSESSCYLSSDLAATQRRDKPKQHEYTSAIVVVKKFKGVISSELGGDVELIARMILGCKYQNDNEEKYQLRNIFIELLHGSIVDADRLDYACRDIWASGYCTSTIDLERLIYSMQIRKHEGKFQLCYNSKAVNEIESMLAVRDYQCKYIINHHTIVYDQYLLRKSAEEMASKYFGTTEFKEYDGSDLNDKGCKEKALGKIINLKSLCDKTSINLKSLCDKTSELTISNIADEDLLFLMKQNENKWYTEWSSRQYRYYALWKTAEEFREFFENSRRIYVCPDKEKFRKAIIAALDTDDIIIEEAEIKPKVKLSDLLLVVNDHVITYENLFPQKQQKEIENSSPEYKPQKFYYVYYPKDSGVARDDIIAKLKEPINKLYSI